MEIKTVLCPLDFTTATERELQVASVICQSFGASMVLQCNLDTTPPSSLGMNWMYAEERMIQEQQEEATAEKRLREAFSRAPSGVTVEGKITHGPRDFAIVHLARECQSDLIVMTQQASSDPDQVTVAERVVVDSPCPVLTVQPTSEPGSLFDNLSPQAAVVPVDFTPHSMRTLDYAFSLARHLPITLQLLHLERASGWRDLQVMPFRRQDERERQLVDCKERLIAMIPPDLKERIRVNLRGGAVTEGILRCLQEFQASLVIMGAHPKGFWKKALTGSTACEILRRSPCPVWFVPTTTGSSSWSEEPNAVSGS
jgi:nucleotide-binding universal stress UspA family protein